MGSHVVACEHDPSVDLLLADQLQVVSSAPLLISITNFVLDPVGLPSFVAYLAQAYVFVKPEKGRDLLFCECSCISTVPHSLSLV
ncbi:hypothetical protein LP52_18245 [Streptomonospora alba]|uniref:Uncharacterized protein n=1 Tax=Streptomonospora alba TaxID=183763 RepID=A0A0C2JLE6_9ACTN|nr:hypothetical protein LP52_18245 [Streptomonospora alba]